MLLRPRGSIASQVRVGLLVIASMAIAGSLAVLGLAIATEGKALRLLMGHAGSLGVPEAQIAALRSQGRLSLALGLALAVLTLVVTVAFSNLIAYRVRRGVQKLLTQLRAVHTPDVPPSEDLPEGDELALVRRELGRTLRQNQVLLQTVRQQQAFQRAVLDGASAAIIGLDPDGRVNLWNRGAERMTGFTAEEIVGRGDPAWWRLPEELEHLAAELSAQLGRPVEPGIPAVQEAAALPGFSSECHYRHRDGHLTEVLLGISQVRTPEGEFLGTMGVAQDLSRIKALESELTSSEARYRSLVDRLPDVVYQTRVWPDGRRAWPFCSAQFEAFYGAPPSVLEANPAYSLDKVHPDDRPGYLAALTEAAAQLSPVTWEGRSYTERPGEIKWVRVRRSPTRLEDGSILWDGLLEDITKLKEAEERLRASEARALEASRAKSVFLANMSHELRTPLSVILGYASLLARTPGRPAAEQGQLLRIQQAGEHLLSLINDVLSLTKIEAGRSEVKLEPFEPERLFSELEGLFHLTATQKGLRFSVDRLGFPPYVNGDKAKIRQIFVNLLGNAFKFTKAGHVTARAAWAEGSAVFAVEDSGPGIPVEDQAGLFTAFQETRRGAALGGAGLGLHISGALAESLGGRMSLQSAEGRGCVFTFTLPLPEIEGPMVGPGEHALPRLAGSGEAPRILVVDDSEGNREILSEILLQVGFRVETAASGLEGVEKWRNLRPDLILMDLRMEEVDGFEAVRRIRRREEAMATRVPVIAVSASVFDVTREMIVEHGFDDFLTKPLDLNRMLDLVRALLGVSWEREAAPGAAQGMGDITALGAQDPAWLERFAAQVKMGDLDAADALLAELPEAGLREAVRGRLRAYRLQDLLEHLG